MTLYRCSQCQFTTTDPTEPDCPYCHGQLIEVEETSEDRLEKDEYLRLS